MFTEHWQSSYTGNRITMMCFGLQFFVFHLIGGHEQATPFDLVECFDPVMEQWTRVSTMLSCRDAVGVTCFANKLFAVGGYNGYMYLNSVECLNLATKKWENMSVLCTGRAGAGVVAVKDTDPPDDEDLGSAL